jgi:hypothetical protein
MQQFLKIKNVERRRSRKYTDDDPVHVDLTQLKAAIKTPAIENNQSRFEDPYLWKFFSEPYIFSISNKIKKYWFGRSKRRIFGKTHCRQRVSICLWGLFKKCWRLNWSFFDFAPVCGFTNITYAH